MNDLSKKKVGDPVYDALGGEWTVKERDYEVGEFLRVNVGRGSLSFWVADNGATQEVAPPTFFSEPVRVIPAQGECDFSGYLAWDLVYFADGTSDVVTSVCDRFISAGKYLNMPLNGKDMTGKQIFFHAPPNLVASNPDAFKVPAHIAERKKAVDWSQVPIDTLVEVRVKGKWKTRYFAGWKSGTPTYFCHGATSHTADELAWATVQLSQIRLANEENTK